MAVIWQCSTDGCESEGMPPNFYWPDGVCPHREPTGLPLTARPVYGDDYWLDVSWRGTSAYNPVDWFSKPLYESPAMLEPSDLYDTDWLLSTP